ncbi:MAG: hypothetical protein ACRD0X_04990 [Thermoanaerobaculia bacterium]
MKPLAKALLALPLTLASTGAALRAGGNTLQVTSPGLEGNFKLEAISDGVSANAVWVQDNSPACEMTYNIEWLTKTVLVDSDDQVLVFQVRSEVGEPNGPAVEVRCAVRRQPGSVTNDQIRCSARQDAGGFRNIGSASYDAATQHRFRVELVRASAPGAVDGIARLFRDGQLRGEISDLDNDTRCLGAGRIGITQSLNAATRPVGSFQFDSYTSFR